MGSIVSHIDDMIKEHGSLEAFEEYLKKEVGDVEKRKNFIQNVVAHFITNPESRISHEDEIWGKERPAPKVGDFCVVYSEDKYWNCLVTHVSKSGKTFWAVDKINKIYFKNVPSDTFKIGHLPIPD